MTGKTVHHMPLRQTAIALIGELGSESNAHGVARIVRSRDSRRKVLWSLMVLFGVGAAISQLSSLVHKYLQYQVVEVSEIQDGHPVEFPSVTVCNIEPISWRKLRQLLSAPVGSSDVPGWLDFLDAFHFGPQDPHLRSIRAFHENVDRDALFVQHGLNESLLHCSFNKQPCSTANFTTSFDGNYYSCFTFNTQPKNVDSKLIVHSIGPEYGLSIVMFLDNNEPPLGSYGLYALDTSILHSAGARVMVHAPNTLPIPVDHGQDVAPGFSTSVSIKPFLHSRLPKPYGNCSDTYLRGMPSFTSTFSTCIAVCKQELIVRTCGCRSSALPDLPAAKHVPYCGQVVNWSTMLRNKHLLNRSQHLPTLECEEVTMERLKNDRGYETDCGCTHPCLELSYHMSTSMSYWPLELYQFHALTQLYGDSIAESPLRRAYQLHDQNIKEGELLRSHMQQQQRQTRPPHAKDPGKGSVSGEKGRGGKDSESFTVTDSPKPHTSEANFQGEFNPLSRDLDLSLNETLSNVAMETATNYSSAASVNDRSKTHRKSAGGKNKGSGGGTSGGSGPGFNENPPYRTLDYNREQMDRLREASVEIRQNLLRLNVYLEDLSVVKYKQMPAYGMEDLFADIGGTLGLWMGVSVLTIMELLELIVRLTHLFLRAEWKPGHRPESSGTDKESGEPEAESRLQSSFGSVRDRDGMRYESVSDQDRMKYESVRDQDRMRYECLKDQDRMRYECLQDQDKMRYECLKDQDRMRYECLKDQDRMKYESVRDQERMRYEPIRQHDGYNSRENPTQNDVIYKDGSSWPSDYTGGTPHMKVNGRNSAPASMTSNRRNYSGRTKFWRLKRAKSKS